MTAGLLGMAARASLSAGIMILAVLALRLQFQDRTPRRVFCLLWDIVLCRLLILSDIPSPLSVRRLLALWPQSSGNAAEVTAFGPMVTGAGAAVNGVYDGVYLVEAPVVQMEAVTSAGSAPAGVDWNLLLTAVWLTAALLGLAHLLWRHLQSRRIYAASAPVQDPFVLGWQADHPLRRPVQVRSCGWIVSPLTYGVLYPVVLLPGEMDLADREGLACVLTHEYTHIRRFDALRKGLLAGALCLHWFNPLVWAMYALANRDIELACDEAVVRSGADRREYALALLRLEEARGGAALSGSYFSRNPLEERIKAIMKIKKVSLAALLAVLVVMSIATTVFATSAPEKEPDEIQTAYGIKPGVVTQDEVLVMTDGEKEERSFSVDGGETWLTEDHYHAQYGGDWGDDWQVEWWTADEYAAWLEQEKKDLQSLIGERAYTSSDGWFVWDQEKVDEAIALYEKELEDIKNGMLYSKNVWLADGSAVEDVALACDGALNAQITAIVEDVALACDRALNAQITAIFDNSVSVLDKDEGVDADALLEELYSFGLTNGPDAFYYNGQRVRTLVDGVAIGDGYSTQYVYTDPKGAVDVHTVRSVIYNPDGSYDPMGDLIGLAAAGEPGFDQGLIDSTRPAATMEDKVERTEAAGRRHFKATGQTFEELFAQYEPYGLTYTPEGNSWGAIAYNGQPAESFFDLKPDGGAFSYENPYGAGGLKIYTVYDENGSLTGLKAE